MHDRIVVDLHVVLAQAFECRRLTVEVGLRDRLYGQVFRRVTRCIIRQGIVRWVRTGKADL